MKAAIFNRVPYLGPAPEGVWPVPAASYATEVAQASMADALDQFQLADELGFDWVTVAEHHYAPFSLTPNPMILAGALTQRVKRAKIALLGANIPILNPVRVAEELAMLDLMTRGRVVAGMLRGTPNEYITYATNPAESRERFEEASKYVPIENLSLSPQCGFASVDQGNLISWEDQKRKLELVVRTARRVWG